MDKYEKRNRDCFYKISAGFHVFCRNHRDPDTSPSRCGAENNGFFDFHDFEGQYTEIIVIYFVLGMLACLILGSCGKCSEPS